MTKKIVAKTPSGIPEEAAIRQENVLVEACYRMTLNEKRVLLLGMSKIKDFAKTWEYDPEAFDFTITTQEYGSTYNDNQARKSLQRAAKLLRGRYVKFHPKAGIVDEINWFDGVRYEKGTIRFRFTTSITTRLKGMQKFGFTESNLLGVKQLASVHSVRFYELMCRWKNWRKVTKIVHLEDLRFSLNCVATHKRTADLRRYVIDPAVKEVNQKSDLKVSYTTIKLGRTITGLEFTIKENDQFELFT